ncbi:MAG: nucleotidyltransferase domain-containing protein [Oscillatoriophycideae cyanobacterium NC_groundwater_1537_Pr4_S-0.65um_50_18]|nr:nucleotidyltransferase domain-containing protein [Oscillatoriophycideae cyanobacterium NC_groundwater_1537_Pr4_S-0.65um_50_18]
MDIYAFGSVCRGDISLGSDVDLLAIVKGHDTRIDPNIFSVYSYERIQALWKEGNPFAWHLSFEARLLFSSNRIDYLSTLGSPETYKNCLSDCQKFFSLFCEAQDSIITGSKSIIFDLSIVFLSIRNMATCFSLGITRQPNFSRNSALHLGFDSIPSTLASYHILEKARILCTRGYGEKLTNDEIDTAIRELTEVSNWMSNLIEKAKENERV